jgi:hypothetical protein
MTGFASLLYPSVRVIVCFGAAVVTLAPTWAQDAIYRCGSEYTNNPTPAQKKECKLLEGGAVTVVPAAKPVRSSAVKPAGGGTAAAVPAADQPRVDPAQQRARDSDARAILEAELKRAEARLADLQREYNNGQPERRGEEVRNVARYQERVADLKAQMARAESDVAGIRRELQRAGGGSGAANAAVGLR